MNKKTNDRFIIKYDELPISNNDYLVPASRLVNGRAIAYMYETKKSKDWKARFRSYLKREVKAQQWDKSITGEGHWYLDCIFYQSRVNQDNNNYYKILCDALTDIATEDDKNVLVRTQKVMYDSKNPRFKAVLRPVKYKGIFKDESEMDSFVDNNCSTCTRFKRNCSILKNAKAGRTQSDIIINDTEMSCKSMKVKVTN